MQETLNEENDFNSRWKSPEPKVLVQRIHPEQNTPQNAQLAKLGWACDNISSQNDIDGCKCEDNVHYRSNVKKVRRRLMCEDECDVTGPPVNSDREPLAQSLDDCLFPEIVTPEDSLLRSPPNVDYLLGCVTPKRYCIASCIL